MCRTPTEGHDTVPLSFPRLAKAAAVIGLAMAPVGTVSMPAFAAAGSEPQWWLGSLHVTQAWRSGEGARVTVAVLADGVSAGQPDLAGSVTAGPDLTRSGRTDGGPFFGVIGTGLASLIAGHGHGKLNRAGYPERGIYGVARDARILSVRVTLSPHDPLWANGKITSRLPAAMAAGIRYAVDHGATVIDLPPDPGLPGLAGWGGVAGIAGASAAERAAIGYAVSKDVVLVAPAGDNAQQGDAPSYPAAYPQVISVGAFGKGFVKAPFSNRRSYVTLTAAGQDMVAAAPAGYQTLSSTWAASAVVAGIAALVRSRFPSLTASQVRAALTEGTVFHPPGGRLDGSGYGTVDALSALNRAAMMSPPHARLAGLGALPRSRPAAPQVASQSSVIAGDLIRDGEISAAAFAVLLVPILTYGSAQRRRERRVALATANRARQASARSTTGGMLADPLLEFFGPQHARPDDRQAGQRTVASPRYQPRPSLTGRSMLSARPALSPSGGLPPQAPPGTPEFSATSESPLARRLRQTSAILGAPTETDAPTITQPPGGLPVRRPGALGGRPFGDPQPAQVGWPSDRTVAGDPGAASTGTASSHAASTRGPSTGTPSTRAPSTRAPSTASTGPASTGFASTGFASTGPASTGPASTGPASTGFASTGFASTGAASTGPASTGAASTGADPDLTDQSGGNGAGDAAARGGQDAEAGPGRTGRDVGFRWANPPASTVKHAAVSGAPPWEPAPQPTTALPWAVVPAPAGGTSPRNLFTPPTRQAPPPSLWGDQPARPESAGKSVFDPEPVPQPADPAPPDATPAAPAAPAAPDPFGLRGDEQSQPPDGQRPEAGGHPIYVWNPSATASTDVFGSVSDDQDE